MKLKNKVAIVTGGARDIGGAVSKKLAAEGAKVVINWFDSEEESKKTLAEITEAGGEAILVHGDMMKAADVANVVAKGQEAFGQNIDILVNVAGGLVKRVPTVEMEEDFYDFVMDLNLKTTWLMTRAVVPHMPAGSSIINFASQAGRDGGGPGASIYATSKGAVMTLTRAWAKEFGPNGIRVNALCPGVISTTFHDTFSKDEVRQNLQNATPLRREGAPSEIGDVVAYLASDESSFLTGVNLDTNGGLLMS